MPIRSSPCVGLLDDLGDLQRRLDGAVGVVVEAVRRPEDAEQPVADELVRVPAVMGEQRDDVVVEAVELGDHVPRARALGERREVADVEEQDGDLDLLALEVHALLEHAVGERGVDEGAERLAQALALLQARDHPVERRRQAARLVAADDRDARGQVPGADPARALLQVLDRPDDRAQEQQRQVQRHREGDGDGEQHPDAQRAQARLVGGQADDDDAGDDVDDRQPHEQSPLQRHGRAPQLDAVGHVGRDALEQRAHGLLDAEEAQEHRVGQRDDDARGDDEHRREQRAPELDRQVDRDRDDVDGDRQPARVAQQVERQARQRAPRVGRRLRRPHAAQPRVDRAQVAEARSTARPRSRRGPRTR